MRLRRGVLIVVTAVVAGLLPVGAAMAADTEGPPLTVPPAELAASLTCTPDVDGATRDPVLLFPAFATAQEVYGASYLKSLPAAGIPTCSITLADRGYDDLQRAAEFAVYAIRTVSERSGRQVSVLGHQHGAIAWMLALRFWPDTPALVSDYISLNTPHHGTDLGLTLCGKLMACSESEWQITTGSNLLAAMNREAPPEGPSYTSISTQFDELIFPQPAASRLTGASNILLQDVCAGRLVEHFSILVDSLTERLVFDALNNPGPADPARLDQPCSGPPLGLPLSLRTLEALPGLVGFAERFVVKSVADPAPGEPALRPEFATG